MRATRRAAQAHRTQLATCAQIAANVEVNEMASSCAQRNQSRERACTSRQLSRTGHAGSKLPHCVCRLDSQNGGDRPSFCAMRAEPQARNRSARPSNQFRTRAPVIGIVRRMDAQVSPCRRTSLNKEAGCPA